MVDGKYVREDVTIVGERFKSIDHISGTFCCKDRKNTDVRTDINHHIIRPNSQRFREIGSFKKDIFYLPYFLEATCCIKSRSISQNKARGRLLPCEGCNHFWPIAIASYSAHTVLSDPQPILSK